ncbi:MAG: NAD(P)-dependent oxidoreductase [Bacteroidota bacterium]|nr:NAD(P)-dependent oxidoreductase [Bacteroidota bacterium]
MNITVTGSTGFIGKYLVKRLSGNGDKVTALGRDIVKLNKTFDDSVNKKETDYSYDSMLNVLKGADAVIHLAGKRFQKQLDPFLIEPYIDSNIILTQNIFKAAKELCIKRIAQTSTIGVYSMTNNLPFSENEVPYPITVYGLSKLSCENMANFYTAKTSVKITNLRLASLFGTGEKTGVVFTDYVNRAIAKKTIEIWGEGKTGIDFLYVKDAVEALFASVQPDAPSGTFNIGSGIGYAVKEIAENINAAFENEGNIKYLKDKKEGGYNVFMNTEKAKKQLDWKPQYSMNEALEDMKSN